MGQNLATGLVTAITVSADSLAKTEVTVEELTEAMQNQALFALDLYNYEPTDQKAYHQWQLKPEVLSRQLIPFLEDFYPAAMLTYPQESVIILSELKQRNPDEWLNLAAQQEFESFQLDKYAHPKYLYFKNKPFYPPSIKVHFNAVILQLSEKILLESDKGLFRFYTYCLHQTFTNHPIARALRLYITG